MSEPKKLFSSKTPVQYVAYALLFLGLIADVLFLILDGSDQTFTIGCFVCIMLGSFIGMADFFVRSDVWLWISSLLYTTAAGFHLSVALPSLSDWWNGVNFIGGNQELALAFGIVFLALTFALIVLNFFPSRRRRTTVV